MNDIALLILLSSGGLLHDVSHFLDFGIESLTETLLDLCGRSTALQIGNIDVGHPRTCLSGDHGGFGIVAKLTDD